MRTFRAWIGEHGGNEDRDHEKWCENPGAPTDRMCDHIRLVDLETSDYRILFRVMRRRKPVFFELLWFGNRSKGLKLLKLGKVAVRW